ncbi:uncharacterized protein LOC116124950 [Pistacia vera]|uniref:uncharacterized protein LOC116124950 n=1 Tax=Pistacia vera TaxID=55513 RepID=UPI001262F8D1|nr:uncharacterized protein LOC116124950 [Pistacia vera]
MRSTSGYNIFLGGNLVQWVSRKQNVVSLSSTKAEYRAFSQTATELVWIQHLFQELGITINNSPILWGDNMSASAFSSNHVFHACSKHIEIDMHYVRELAVEKNLCVHYVGTRYQVADILTKALPSVVESARLIWDEKSMIEVIGYGAGAVKIVTLMIKKFKYAELVSMGPTGSEKKEGDKAKSQVLYPTSSQNMSSLSNRTIDRMFDSPVGSAVLGDASLEKSKEFVTGRLDPDATSLSDQASIQLAQSLPTTAHGIRKEL